jgi:hypothetical protein
MLTLVCLRLTLAGPPERSPGGTLAQDRPVDHTLIERDLTETEP